MRGRREAGAGSTNPTPDVQRLARRGAAYSTNGCRASSPAGALATVFANLCDVRSVIGNPSQDIAPRCMTRAILDLTLGAVRHMRRHEAVDRCWER